MEIIDFPGRKPRAVRMDQSKMTLGPMRFSCECGNVSEIQVNGAIFRYIDFYCSNCGTPYRVTNPAFVRSLPKKPPA